MEKIKVDKKHLLDRLNKNRETHESEYLEANQGYIESVIDAQTKALQIAIDIGEVQTYFDFNKPTNCLKSYNFAIEVCNMSIDDVIELTQREFQQYVMDEWEWSDNFKMVTDSYKK